MFRDWLGKENGKQMLAEIFNDCTVDQARAAVTTYCNIFRIAVDTSDWDELMQWIFNYYNSWFATYDALDNYMCELLV